MFLLLIAACTGVTEPKTVDNGDSGDSPCSLVIYTDADGDGYAADDAIALAGEFCAPEVGTTELLGDCDDAVSSINPGGSEICDASGTDEDCDGLVNDADDSLDSGSTTTWYADADADTYGDANTTIDACVSPAGYVNEDSDCNDARAAINPGATEVCDDDDTDEDCNGLANDADPDVEADTQILAYADADGDTFGNADAVVSVCTMPDGHVADSADCNDDIAAINPAATEICDAADTDEDCDSVADDLDASTDPSTKTDTYADLDHDGYGDSTNALISCDGAPDYLANSDDCDDASDAVNPGAEEICDATDADEDCDGLTDDDDSSVRVSSQSTFYADPDGNGYGEPDDTMTACEVPAGYVAALATADADVCASGALADDTDVGTVDGADFTFSSGDAFTFAFRASLDGLVSGHVAVKGDNATNEWSVTATSTGSGTTTTLCLNRQGLANLNCQTVSAGEYHAYTVTYSAGTSTWYEDGVAIGTGTGTIGSGSSSSALTIGNYPGASSASIGELDDISIWSAALTETQVVDQYTGESAPNDIAGLVGWWRFDEGSGNTTADLSGLGNDMDLSGYGWVTECLDDACVSIEFADDTDYGSVADGGALAFGPTDSFVVDFTALISDTGHILVKGDNSTNEWSITASVSGSTVTLCFNRQGLSNIACVNTTANVWHDMGVSYDAGTVTWVIDGVTAGYNFGSIGSASASDLTFGSYPVGLNSMIGTYSRMAIYDRALTLSEYVSLHAGAEYATVSGAVAIWSFDESSGTLVTDTSGNGHDITLVGTEFAADCPE